MSLVKDVERMGDYAVNRAKLAQHRRNTIPAEAAMAESPPDQDGRRASADADPSGVQRLR